LPRTVKSGQFSSPQNGIEKQLSDPQKVSGVLQHGKRDGVLRDPAFSFKPRPTDPLVPRRLIQELDLPEGALIEGEAAAHGRGPLELKSVEKCCGLKPDAFAKRTRFDKLVSVDPTERFHLARTGNLTMRVVDLFAPIGKGTRAMIVSPPKAGKTTILQDIANGIHADQPKARIIVLLIDERPEEVTHWRRSAPAEVLASRNDQPPEAHMGLVQLTYGHVRCELECGHDVVVLMDSLTRMARAFNLGSSGERGMMSGGIEAGALELPRRFLGLARNVEHGGSVTIIGTVLVDTGSRMDNLIFEEFKGTGNSEIILDRKLAEARIFPAIDILRSGTRKEEKLLTAAETARVAMLRRSLGGRDTRHAMNDVLTAFRKFPDNQALLDAIRV